MFQPLTQSQDKEKGKMMSVEMIKTMGCIKEVNESDVSETSSPAPSPSMFMSDAARARMKDQRSGIFICLLKFMFRSFDFKLFHLNLGQP